MAAKLTEKDFAEGGLPVISYMPPKPLYKATFDLFFTTSILVIL
jgi:hypothetical protein